MIEAAPICRGKNLTMETVFAFLNAIPKHPLPKDEFNSYAEKQMKGWTQTHSQIARQLALYYEKDGVCYPRFCRTCSKEEVYSYVEKWASLYFIPNPYTPSLTLQEGQLPINIYSSLRNMISEGISDFEQACFQLLNTQLSSLDKLRVYLNNFTNIFIENNVMRLSKGLIENGCPSVHPDIRDYKDGIEYFYYFGKEMSTSTSTSQNKMEDKYHSFYRPYITAIKSKPFLLLAGISGTGKSRIVRELARACWDENSEEHKAQKPRNFEMVQVKPNWHDSTELIGYVSRVSGKPEFVAGDFLKFVARAWQETDVPYFLCLDEMNLAPVEQYFAEYLSVIESRKLGEDGNIKTDAVLEPAYEKDYNEQTGRYKLKAWYDNLIKELLAQCPPEKQFELTRRFEDEGITLPPNLIVVGTVNMDETTFSFSRKVLDRAMTIEMNEVDLRGGLDTRYEPIGKLGAEELIGNAVEVVDVYVENKEVCDKALAYLQSVNDVLDKEGKPFKVAYRTRNEFLLYVLNNLPYDKDKQGNTLPQEYVIARALDEITNMKILPRIEGDDTKVTDKLLDNLKSAIEDGLKALTGEEQQIESVSIAKLGEMKKRLNASGYTSFWS